MLRHLLLSALLLVGAAGAQERIAHIRLDDGRELEGRVVEMDLGKLRLQVGDEIIEVRADRFRSCRIESCDPEQPDAVAPLPEPPVANDADKAEAAKVGKPTWTAPLRDPEDPEASRQLPFDQRITPRWRQRLQLLDEAYPWLVPAAPLQWVSIGLLLAVGLSLIVQLSATVAGGEGARLSRSTGVGLWYLVSGVAQFALAPVNHLSSVLMLLGNTSLALFCLCSLFGLTRAAALVALSVQIGCVMIAYGALELITSLLASTGAIM